MANVWQMAMAPSPDNPQGEAAKTLATAGSGQSPAAQLKCWAGQAASQTKSIQLDS